MKDKSALKVSWS